MLQYLLPQRVVRFARSIGHCGGSVRSCVRTPMSELQSVGQYDYWQLIFPSLGTTRPRAALRASRCVPLTRLHDGTGSKLMEPFTFALDPAPLTALSSGPPFTTCAPSNVYTAALSMHIWFRMLCVCPFCAFNTFTAQTQA